MDIFFYPRGALTEERISAPCGSLKKKWLCKNKLRTSPPAPCFGNVSLATGRRSAKNLY